MQAIVALAACVCSVCCCGRHKFTRPHPLSLSLSPLLGSDAGFALALHVHKWHKK